MNHQAGEPPFPSRRAILSAMALIGFTLLAVTTSRLTAVGVTELPTAVPTISRALIFEDMPDGSVLVSDPVEQVVIDRFNPGDGGFVRGVLRSLNRGRKLRGVTVEHAYDLVRWDDGRLSLLDPVTGARVDLEAFGPTNFESFARLLGTTSLEMPLDSQVSLRH